MNVNMNLDINQEEFMQRLKMQGNDVDAELDALEDEIPELRADKNKKKGGVDLDNLGDNDDLNLSDLEKEDEKEDPNLKAIEEELNNPDMWDDEIENAYHNAENMKSISVLQEEDKIIDEIIKFKSLRGTDTKKFELKKKLVVAYAKKIERDVEYENLSQEEYINNIRVSLTVEKEKIKKAQNDSKVEYFDFLKKRIEKRIQLINSELSEDVEEPEPQKEPEPEATQIKTGVNDKMVLNENIIRKEDVHVELKEEKGIIKSDDVVLIEKKDSAHAGGPPIKRQESKLSQLEKLISDRLDDYKEALKYFKRNVLTTQEEECKDKIEIIKTGLTKLKSDMNAAIKNLPDKVKPDFICGCDAETRKKKFMEAINEFQELRKGAKGKFSDFQESIQKIDKGKLKKISKEVGKKLEEMKKKVDSYEVMLKKFVELLKDEWVPPPLTEIRQEEEKVEKVNLDVKENVMLITVGKTTITNETAVLKVNLTHDGKTIIDEISNLTGGTFNYKAELNLAQFKKSDLKNLNKTNMVLEVMAKACCLCPVTSQGVLPVPLTELTAKCEVKNNYSIPGGSDKVEVGLKLRVPLVEKEYEIQLHDRLTIKKLYPSYNTEKKPEPPKPQNVAPKQPSSQKQAPAGQAPVEESKAITYDVSEFTSEELTDPDIIANLMAMTVLKNRLKIMEEKYAKVEGRPPRELRERLMKIRVNLKCLEKSIEEGAISMDAYIGKLNMQLLHDRKLLQYFKDKKDLEKAKICQERVTMMVSELKELQ